MLLAITNLQQNESISTNEIEQLQILYTKMNDEAKRTMQTTTQNISKPVNIVYKEIDKKTVCKKLYFSLLLYFLCLLVVF